MQQLSYPLLPCSGTGSPPAVYLAFQYNISYDTPLFITPITTGLAICLLSLTFELRECAASAAEERQRSLHDTHPL